MKNLLNQWANASSPQRLELVFENKNKAYGAYKIRLEQSKNQVYAMIITLGVFLVLALGFRLYYQMVEKPDSQNTIIDVKPIDSMIIREFRIEPDITTEKGSNKGSNMSNKTFKHVTPTINGKDKFNPNLINFNGDPGLTNFRGDKGLFGPDKFGTGLDSGKPLFDKKKSYVVNVESMFNHPSLNINQFIQSEFVLPESCPSDMRTAYVTVSFVVDREGRVGSLHVEDETKSCKAFTTEILRILKLTSWIPASKNGVPVESYHKLPIVLDVSNY